MSYHAYSLNGTWEMCYSESRYLDTKNPWKKGVAIPNAVPGYWEDMKDQFRAAMQYSGSLNINPEYGMQSYPITGVAPDMALPNIMGNFFYHRKFLWNPADGAVTIHFEGVQNAASVWLNDVYLGRHEGYSTPFSMEIPQKALNAGENDIVLSVSNIELTGFDGRMVSGLTNRAANQYTGGIIGDVELRVYPTALRDFAVLISSDCETAQVRLTTDGEAEYEWEVWDGDQHLFNGSCCGDFTFATEGLQRWSPENPKLYTLLLRCGDVCLERSFGVRRLLVDDVHLRLNGHPYYLRGICEHCYYPMTVYPSQDILHYRQVIRKLKELGFNFIRFHTYVPNEAYLQAADELGILVQVECPNYASLEEWKQIVLFCRKHPCVVIYCTGNELMLDEDDFVIHLRSCSDYVHNESDSLYSPMSALRRLEYLFYDDEIPYQVQEPFVHNPDWFRVYNAFSDLYNSYTVSTTSYVSLKGDPRRLDDWSRVYNKPRLSHEICIHGTYTDLSLKDRYRGTRIGATDMFASIERHLHEKGLLERAPLYFQNSSQWQRRLRKHCFETMRLCQNFAGYDFLGPIDTHWHTFGYDVGMMNEFYELKPGETVRNVRMYNSPVVVLADFGTNFNFTAGQPLDFTAYASNYGDSELTAPELNIRLMMGKQCIARQRLQAEPVPCGKVQPLYHFHMELPTVDKPQALMLYMTLEDGHVFAENEWELYLFPEVPAIQDEKLLVRNSMEPEALLEALRQGQDVLLLGSAPLPSLKTTFQIALAGRTAGNLATVIADHPLLEDLPHDGFCGWQFRHLLEGGSAVCFEDLAVPFDPIVEVVSTHKCAIRQAALFEYRALNGRLLVCTFHFDDGDPAARWLKQRLLEYVSGDGFDPAVHLDESQLQLLMNTAATKAAENTNFALNPNDKASSGKKFKK